MESYGVTVTCTVHSTHYKQRNVKKRNIAQSSSRKHEISTAAEVLLHVYSSGRKKERQLLPALYEHCEFNMSVHQGPILRHSCVPGKVGVNQKLHSTIYFRRHNNIMVYLLRFNITCIIILATCFDSYESSSGLNFKSYCTYCFTVFCLTVFS